MIDYYTLPDEILPMSMRYFRKELKVRGWKVEKSYRESQNNLILTRPDSKELKVASSTPPTTSVYACRLADDKMMSYELLKNLGVPQPETKIIRQADEALPMLEQYGAIVIKPIDGAHGRGVTVGIRNIDQVAGAIRRAEEASPELRRAIMQPQLAPGELELRIICIDYHFVEAIARIPAQVTGDGSHTLGELIKLENSTIREQAYRGALAYIDEAAARNFLGEKINFVSEANEKIQVVGSCNIGQGGTAEDYSDRITEEQRELSAKIARAAELPVIGIDFYGDQVIELNACPSLYYPTGDESATRAISAYIDYLATI